MAVVKPVVPETSVVGAVPVRIDVVKEDLAGASRDPELMTGVVPGVTRISLNVIDV